MGERTAEDVKRDPRKDPRAGDIIGFRDKPLREIIYRFTDVCGDDWVTYTIRKQMPVSRWKRNTQGAEVIHIAQPKEKTEQ